MGEVEKTIAQENEMECLRTGVLNQCLLMYLSLCTLKSPCCGLSHKELLSGKNYFTYDKGDACQNSA